MYLWESRQARCVASRVLPEGSQPDFMRRVQIPSFCMFANVARVKLASAATLGASTRNLKDDQRGWETAWTVFL